MIDGDAFQDVLEDVRILVEREAHPARGTLRLSGEVAALIEGVGGAAEDVGAAAGDATAEDVEAGLAALEEAVGRCAGCGLAEGRTHVVFGEGSPRADLVFVGEAPGFNEDKAGKPFVGAAGRLLTDIIVKGMKLRRRDVYICNVLKCRPPNNR
ncbi:MAG: uracil-DNA glycosylase, partial [Candidatus Hydrogenedentes bacterium]|nr:uracil-DNA glycosylase [Candidatus Hydrogenedentota bacterium]